LAADPPQSPQVGHKLTVAYLGTGYSGWQIQPGKNTVQAQLERALEKIWTQKISAQSSGRTDTGVHALGQTVSFTAPRRYTPSVLVRALNANLPEDIRVLKARLMPPEFHARFEAKGKTYEYHLLNHAVGDPFLLDRAWHVPQWLDDKAMRQAARLFLGKHDFASFTSNPGYERETTVRTVKTSKLTVQGDMMMYTVTADGFLYRMVRNLVGALVRVGLGKMTVEQCAKILQAQSRSIGPATAPAHGLYLVKVFY
jgi:tRNA pseudouridine38-40 synthase